MSDLFFYIFAGLTIVCGFLVVANPFSRNPVTSAMFLVLTIVSLAGLFVLLQAFFLAAVQILVYAGAVMVLFLFVIMLLDLKVEQRRKLNRFGVVTGLIGVAALGFVVLSTILHSSIGQGQKVEGSGATVSELGVKLFTDYLLPFEVVSLLLLVAMVGVVLLSKKDLR